MDKIVVQTKTYFEPDVKDDLMELSSKSFQIFKQQKGLISIRMHINQEENHMMTLLEWETMEEHEACMQSPDFDDWNEIWQRLAEEGKIRWKLDIYKVLHDYHSQ